MLTGHLGMSIGNIEQKASQWAAVAQRWCTAVNNDAWLDHRTYRLVMHPSDLGKILDQQPAMAKLEAA